MSNKNDYPHNMRKEYTNKDVYEFLAAECQYNPELWKVFGEGIATQTEDADFWDSLSEELDCFRICDECGKPMIEGYLVDGCDTYCSDDCLHQHLTDEEYQALYNDCDGDTYWTNWYEDSKTFRNSR